MLTSLPDNLVLRRGRPEDAEPLSEFNAKWLSHDGPDEPEEPLAAWTRDVFTKPHPTFSPELATIVEDANTGAIVSSIILFPQTWTYAGIPFGVGRPELIATHPDYRKRGLVRLQMETVHDWSAELGHRMQVITGIPWFYRQFGYEMGLDLTGGRIAFPDTVPELQKDADEPYRFRRAETDDIDFITGCYASECRRDLIACEKDADLWEYELTGRSAGNGVRMEIGMITDTDGTPAGCFAHPGHLWGKTLGLHFFGAAPGRSWLDLAPPMMRHLERTGRSFAADAEGSSFKEIFFNLGTNHPVFDVLPNAFPRERRPYAWYVRVADVPGFLEHIRPALEERLAGSSLAGYSGEVKIGFYRSGVLLKLNEGRFESIESWQPVVDDEGHLRFPDLTFLSLLCGRRSFDELADFYADCFATKDEYAALMRAMFPKQTSNVWGVV
jgi:hypothetical protein